MPYPPLRRHTVSFKHAFEGLFYTVKTQPNFRIHLLASLIVVFLAFYLKVTAEEWVALVVAILLVFSAEMLNTSIEALTDLITTEFKPQAKTAKDVAAAMVLVSALAAAIIGLIVFMPYFIKQFSNLAI